MNELNPVINYEARYSGKHSMLKRFGEIQDPSKKVCDDVGLDMTSIGPVAFSRR